jgi:hypothetical protein
MRIVKPRRAFLAIRTLFSCVICLALPLAGAACTKKAPPSDPLLADVGVQFPDGFPRDPGDRGKSGLQGIDSDGDGVRDDIQRWIYARHPQDPRKRAALGQVAKSYTDLIQPKDSQESMLRSMRAFSKAIDCLSAVIPDMQARHVERAYLKARALNTAERSRAFLRNDALLDGTTSGPSTKKGAASCD